LKLVGPVIFRSIQSEHSSTEVLKVLLGVPLLRCPGDVEYARGVAVLWSAPRTGSETENSWARAATSTD
jgi:hypothetical protein